MQAVLANELMGVGLAHYMTSEQVTHASVSTFCEGMVSAEALL